MPDPQGPAYFRNAIVDELHRIWPEPIVCDDDAWLRLVDDPRVVDVSTLDDLDDARHRLVLAAAPEGDDRG